jgi:hypothetical protein
MEAVGKTQDKAGMVEDGFSHMAKWRGAIANLSWESVESQ